MSRCEDKGSPKLKQRAMREVTRRSEDSYARENVNVSATGRNSKTRFATDTAESRKCGNVNVPATGRNSTKNRRPRELDAQPGAKYSGEQKGEKQITAARAQTVWPGDRNPVRKRKGEVQGMKPTTVVQRGR